jgi:catechol 2,3-dioxygenase-like lactoylglutathione lyase family enzyme
MTVGGIDHLVVAARELDRARRCYERLGFTLTPRGEHSLGSSNQCMMFRDGDYLELLAIGVPGRRPYYEAFLARREGAAALAFATESAEATRAAWEAAGLRAAPLEAFGRPVDLPTGREEARFVTVTLELAQTPEARLFACQHLTPALVWLPDHLDHANGARGIASITIVTADPSATAAVHARATGRLATSTVGECGIELGATALRFVTPAGAAALFPDDPLLEREPPFIAAARLRVPDRAATEGLFDSQGVHRRTSPDGALLVPSGEAIGLVLEFA